MNTIEEVRTRRFAAMVAEALGNEARPGLADRVVQRLRALPVRRRPSPTLVAAALLVAGVAVVCGVAGLQHARTSTPASQDPGAKSQQAPIAELSTENVLAAVQAIGAVASRDAEARLLAITSQAKAGIVLLPGVLGQSTVNLNGATWREAIDRIAAEQLVAVAEYGNVVVVGSGAPPVPPERARVTIHLGEVDVREFVKVLHAKTGANLVLAGDVVGRVRCDVVAVPWRSLLDVATQQLNLDVVGCGSVLALRRSVPKAPPVRTYLSMQQRPIAEVLGKWALLTGGNFVIAPEVQGTVSVSAFSPDQASLLAALAAAGGADATTDDRGIKRFSPSPASLGSTSLTAENISLRQLAATLVDGDEPRVEVADAVTAAVSVLADGALIDDVLRAACTAVGRRLMTTKMGYRIE